METLDLFVPRGTTQQTVTVTILTGGVALDLTGAVFLSRVRSQCGDVVAELDVSLLGPASDGVLEVNLSDEATAGLEVGSHLWDLIVELGSGEVLAPIVGGQYLVSKTQTLG